MRGLFFGPFGSVALKCRLCFRGDVFGGDLNRVRAFFGRIADFVRHINAAKGDYAVIKGPLKDNKGKEVVPAGKSYPETAIELESMDYLLDGVIGSTS